MGTFASRGTHRIGNAIIMAAKEAQAVLLEVAAEELEVDAADLETDGKGNIQVKGSPGKSISVFETALAAHFKHGKTISGRGMFLQPRSYPEPETGKMRPPPAMPMPARSPRSRSTPRPARSRCCR